jgi:hypothetical protein
VQSNELEAWTTFRLDGVGLIVGFMVCVAALVGAVEADFVGGIVDVAFIVGVADASSAVGVTEELSLVDIAVAGSTVGGMFVDSSGVSTGGVSDVSCCSRPAGVVGLLAEGARLPACAITGAVPIMPGFANIRLKKTNNVIIRNIALFIIVDSLLEPVLSSPAQAAQVPG